MSNTTRPGRRIGQIAADLGLNPKTIRYYEEIGLLPPATRTASGYRQYDARDLERLSFIGKAKAIGLTLDEIREVLALREDGERPCEHVQGLIDQKLELVDRQLSALTEFREELVTLREEAAQAVGEDAPVCRIIEHHEGTHAAENALGTLARVSPRRSRPG